MAVPFALGYSWMKEMGSTNLVRIFVGASITVASIGAIAKVLSELGYLKRA
jgi:Kef-type K+ transport system membrane component KefB